MSDDKALSTALELKKQSLAKNVTAEESANLKNSLLFQYNWPELLQSAPTAINSMGACFIAASSPKAIVDLTPPAKGFEYLRYTSLQANLVETANLGRYAFNRAETGMGQISQASDIIYGKLKDVLNMLGDPEAAKVMLKPQMGAVSKSATTCAETAKSIEGEFHKWLFYACEMHAACVQQEQSTAEQALSNEVCIAAEQTRLKTTEESVNTAKNAVDLLGKQVEITSEAFKTASKEFPSGWDVLGQQVVGDFANAASSALKAAIPALVTAINPVSGVLSQGQSVVGNFANKGANGAAGTGPRPAPGVDNTKLKPQSATDPAGPEIVKDMTYIELLNVIVNGPDGGIDWEKARGGGDPKKSVAFISKMLEDSKSTFASIKTSTPASNDVTKILDTTTQVAAGLMSVVKASKSASANWPAHDAPEVKQWVSDFREQYTAAVKASAVAAANNGGATTGAIMSDAEPATEASGGDSQANAVLESAKNRLNTTQQAYLATQDNYLKASTLLVEQQNKVANIQADLTKLTNQNITLTEIKKILIQSIKLIIQLKTQINNLVQFFSAITVIISSVVNLHVQPFLETVKAITSGGSASGDSWVIGNYTMTDYMRSNVYSSVLTLRTYFSVFGDIAKMWMQLSIENIRPGMRMCDEISVTSGDSGDLPKKMKMLADWSAAAADKIRKLAGDKQAQITDGMESRIGDIARDTQLLPAPPAQKAIEAAKAETTAEVSQALETKKKSSPMNRFSAD